MPCTADLSLLNRVVAYGLRVDYHGNLLHLLLIDLYGSVRSVEWGITPENPTHPQILLRDIQSNTSMLPTKIRNIKSPTSQNLSDLEFYLSTLKVQDEMRRCRSIPHI